MILSRDTFRALNVTRPDSMIFVGVDLGKKENYSAIVVVERFEEMPEFTDVLRGKGMKTRYVVRHAERLSLGTEYRDVVARVKQVVSGVLNQYGPCVVVVDEGGPGVPVVEMMREVGMGCAILPYTITTGAKATGTSVPRAELVTKLQLMLERGELEIAAGCRDGEALRRELEHMQLSGKAAGEQDDLVMALALALWRARVR